MRGGLKKCGNRAVDFIIGPTDAIRLRAFELSFTAAFLIYMAGRFRHFQEWLTPAGFHYTAEANLSYQIDPFPLLQTWSAIGLGILIFTAGVLFIQNRNRKFGLAILFSAAVFIQHVDSAASFTLNKFFIVGFLVLLISPAMPSDTRNGLVRSAWSIRILQATILIQFFTAGTCKVLYGDWIEHQDVLWSQVQGRYRTDIAAWMLRNLSKSAWSNMQHIALAFELAGPFLIAWRRTRIFGLIWAAGFLLIITLTMAQLYFFTLQLGAFLILFVKAEHLRKGMTLWDKLLFKNSGTSQKPV